MALTDRASVNVINGRRGVAAHVDSTPAYLELRGTASKCIPQRVACYDVQRATCQAVADTLPAEGIVWVHAPDLTRTRRRGANVTNPNYVSSSCRPVSPSPSNVIASALSARSTNIVFSW